MNQKLSWWLVTWLTWQCSCSIPKGAQRFVCEPKHHHEQYDKFDRAIKKIAVLGPDTDPVLSPCSGLRCPDDEIDWFPEAK